MFETGDMIMAEGVLKTVITLDEEQFDGRYINAAKIDVINKNGTISTKYVDLTALVQALIDSKSGELRYHQIGKLPQGFFDGQIVRDDQNEISGRILVTASKCKTYISFENSRFTACCPAFLFNFEIDQGRLRSTKVYALKGTTWNNDTKLYNCPFGNVATNDHHVCWGSNSLPHIDSLHKLDVVVSMFYDSPYNNDYFRPGVSIKWKCNNLREVLTRLEKQEEFPDRLLVPTGITIKDLYK